MDHIDELVDAALARGFRKPASELCRHCGQEWHGRPNSLYCMGSHLKKRKRNTAAPNAVVDWTQH